MNDPPRGSSRAAAFPKPFLGRADGSNSTPTDKPITEERGAESAPVFPRPRGEMTVGERQSIPHDGKSIAPRRPSLSVAVGRLVEESNRSLTRLRQYSRPRRVAIKFVAIVLHGVFLAIFILLILRVSVVLGTGVFIAFVLSGALAEFLRSRNAPDSNTIHMGRVARFNLWLDDAMHAPFLVASERALAPREPIEVTT